MRVWLPRGTSRRTSSTGGWSRRPGASGLGVTAAHRVVRVIGHFVLLGLVPGVVAGPGRDDGGPGPDKFRT